MIDGLDNVIGAQMERMGLLHHHMADDLRQEAIVRLHALVERKNPDHPLGFAKRAARLVILEAVRELGINDCNITQHKQDVTTMAGYDALQDLITKGEGMYIQLDQLLTIMRRVRDAMYGENV